MLKKNRKGAALFIVMILSALILLIIGLFATLAQASYKSQALNISGNKALSVAEKGINDLINPLTPSLFTSFTTNTDPVLYPYNNYSYYWAKEVKDPAIFLMHGEATYLFSVNYYKFNVYIIGVISKADLSGLGTEDLKTLTEAGEITINNKKITVDSERIIYLTMFEKDNLDEEGNPDGTISFVSNTATPEGFDSPSPYPFPYRLDWQEVDLATFKNPPGS